MRRWVSFSSCFYEQCKTRVLNTYYLPLDCVPSHATTALPFLAPAAAVFIYKFEDAAGKFGASQALLTQTSFVPYALAWGQSVCVAGNAGARTVWVFGAQRKEAECDLAVWHMGGKEGDEVTLP